MFKRRYADLWPASDGASAIEFGLMLPFLTLLLLGIVDFGRGFWEQMQVANAAQAGATYVQRHGYNYANAQTAGESATNLAIHVEPAQACGCPNASSGISDAACGSACPAGGTAATYTKVTASISYRTIFPWPGIARPMTLSATAWTQ